MYTHTYIHAKAYGDVSMSEAPYVLGLGWSPCPF